MAFVKLDTGILNSSVWVDLETRNVFLTALLMATPYEAREELPQLAVDSLKPTGWKVPPGWYGLAEAASVGIVRQAGVDQARGLEALARMGEPEDCSRSQEFEGRRIVRVNGGFLVLNFMHYREKDHGAAERQRRYRERKRQLAAVVRQPTGFDDEELRLGRMAIRERGDEP